MEKVLTAPMAVIKVQGIPVGLMKNIRVTESFSRGKVSGLGALIPSELPALQWSGQLNCGFYMIDLEKTTIPGAVNRSVDTIQQWIDNVLLQEEGVDIDIYKKVVSSTNPNGLVEAAQKPIASIKGCFIDRESFDVNEGQISGRNQDFTYLNPILVSQ